MSRRQRGNSKKAKFIFHMKIPDIEQDILEEDILSEEEKKEIEFNIQPIMTGWREKLLLFLPNLLQSKKYDSQWFFVPINEFVKKHHMVDSDGKLSLNTQSTDKHHLRLLYRLWLLIKKQMRYYGMSLSRCGKERELNLDFIAKLSQINQRENKHLRERLDRLQKELWDIKLHPPVLPPSGVMFDSSSDEEMEV